MTTTIDDSANALLVRVLGLWGLESLASEVWEWHKAGRSFEQILLDLRETPQYQTRFPAMKALGAKGRAISEEQYIAYEQSVAELFHGAALPGGFYDGPEDFAQFLMNDISINELADRINQGYLLVASAPIEVRDAFTNFFGVNGDGALAAYFLDKDRAAPLLMQQAASAAFAGAGAVTGTFGISQDLAMRAAQVGVTTAQALSGFQELADVRPLFTETITESTDLREQVEGVGATFGLDATSAEALRLRRQRREAAFSGTGGALVTQEGAVGLGAAEGG